MDPLDLHPHVLPSLAMSRPAPLERDTSGPQLPGGQLGARHLFVASALVESGLLICRQQGPRSWTHTRNAWMILASHTSLPYLMGS